MPQWLKDAVFYEIYPQSFNDTNNDGIGDIPGIIEKLDYVKGLGCNALWLNPLFDSPFHDAGYDVRDYKKVAPRYGTNDDLVHLFDEAHKRGIKVLLDLVPGHTSDEHEWFLKSKEPDRNEYSDRYVWTNGAFVGIKDHPYVSGASDRDGAYMLNFFVNQPALNYGWLDATEPWMSKVDSPEAIATREAMKDIMGFWLDKGCDGFRVDMADSLVKNDDEHKSATAAIWHNVREMLDQDYPEAAIVSEWSNPDQAINLGGFHMDFYLDHWWNGYNTLLRDYETEGGDHSYFKMDAGGTIRRFLDDYLPKYEATRDNGYISMFTCNHDTPRPARTLSVSELTLAYAFIFTMPGVPFLYYGDEIGMDYLDVRTKEGGFHRTGSRTPMQWAKGEKNLGFSDSDTPYLKVDDRVLAPSVDTQEGKKGSLYETTKALIALRHQYEDLQADALFECLNEEPFVYKRGSMVLSLNPTSKTKTVSLDALKDREMVYVIGDVTLKGDTLVMGRQSFAVMK